eukprot:jgi/Chrzof1/14005/Cz08g20260.t1
MIFAARRIGCFGCTPQVLPQSAQSAGKPQHFLSGMSAPTSSGKCDVYGFPFDPTPSELSDYSSCQQYEQRRAAKWSTLAASQTLPSGGKLKRYLRKGVPHQYRNWVWWQISGAQRKRQAYPADYYEKMIMTGEAKVSAKQIELDLPRTFPRNAWINSTEGQATLRRVLTAYSAHNPDVGYCQGMNFLVALLLLALDKDQEKAFWVMVVLLDDILYANTFAPNLNGCHVEMRALGDLIAAKMPQLHAHLQATGCDVSLLATDWYLCLFSTSLPSEAAARVWDALLYEGAKVIYRVALALLKMHEQAILARDNAGEILKVVKQAAQHTYNRDRLMSIAFEDVGSMPMSRVHNLRSAHQKAVDEEMAARAAERRKYTLKESITSAQQFQGERVEKAGFAANGTNQLPSAPAGTPATVAQGQAPLVAQAALTQAQAAAANMRQGLTAVMGSFGRGSTNTSSRTAPQQ